MASDGNATRSTRARRRGQRRLGGAPMPGRVVPGQPETQDSPPSSDCNPEPAAKQFVAQQLPDGFVTSDELDVQEGEAARLHEELAGIRDLLDAPLPPLPPAPTYRDRLRRHPVAGALALLALIAVLVLIIFVVTKSASSDAADRAPQSTRQSTPQAGASSAPSSTTPADLPASGPGIDRTGAAVGAQVLADRDIQVTEQAKLEPRDSSDDDSLRLAVPGNPLTGDGRSLEPGVKDLTATVDGTTVPVDHQGQEWTLKLPDGDGQRTIQVTYRLTDAVAVSQPSSSGRALALVTPLLAQYARNQDDPVQMQIPADGVQNVVCAGTDQAQSLCGTKSGTNWHVSIPDDAVLAAVLLQFDLKSSPEI